jgi:hypothetical protein
MAAEPDLTNQEKSRLTENDSTKQEIRIEENTSKKAKENNEEKTHSILSVNLLFEIVNHLNLRDLFRINN